MKKILLSAGLCMLVSFSFAQKKAVKEAKMATNSDNFSEARTLIKPALTDPETANDPETWKVAGDIENAAFEKERNNELIKKDVNQQVMYNALMALYEPYIKADSLGQLPDEKGKIKNKFRKDIIGKLKTNHSYYYNGGAYFNENKEYSKASDFFARYWELPSLSIFEDDKIIADGDSTFQTIKYYAVICALQAEEHPKAINFLKRLKSEPYVQNSTFKESDVYELLASEYNSLNDSVNFLVILEEGAVKYPENNYFLPNLINLYIQKGQSDKAIAYLDKAIENNPSSLCDMSSVKASLFAEKLDFEKSDVIYKDVLAKDPNCERALEGLSISYIVQAQNYKEEAGKISNNKDRAALDDKAKDCYTNAFPLLEKYRSLMETRGADEDQIKGALVKLQNVYYNLNMDTELDAITSLLEKQ